MNSQHDHILTLLRSGALEQAEKEYLRHGLDTDQSSEDVMALGGRILKARALEHDGVERQRLALQAAEKYEAAHTKFNGTFSGINTAALYLVAGHIEQAQKIARSIQTLLNRSSPKPGADAYYHMATLAEAWLILGDHHRAEHMFADAIPLDPHNYDAHASTIKQFEMLLAALDQPNEWLAQFRPPKSLHYAGHLFGLKEGKNSLDNSAIYGLEKAIDDFLETDNYGVAYGALAAGSDIIIAERLLEKGVELNVVQPCPDQLFSRLSLTPFGSGWQTRFDACIHRAASIRYVSQDETVCDSLTTTFASETAMGLAVLHANRLATNAEQLLVWDNDLTQATAGTARDAQLWQKTGQQQHVIPFPFTRNTRSNSLTKNNDTRSLKAMLFADVSGFGNLSEQEIPLFVSQILRPLAEQCHAAQAEHINTWGDGLFIVFNSVAAAAKTATDLQTSFRSINLSSAGLPEELALRIGGHYGPVHSLEDPFLHKSGIFGREVTVAARIEPVTAPGSIFVSEPFACALVLNNQHEFRCEPMPEPVFGKNTGPMTLFSLRRIKPARNQS
ncbi:adenylate/guanylate cyclase domain-containing protein [Kordiimonas aquimaris]|uniref:adenylate/guanylate cyclase domain-containing protein n=1 Tax=Kordiimonas aquimaris TaxID=707591 RepID=UPI0021D08C3D|nr:adenylate/guanylate cyclase domain-containing protein [Kordiimonas aquimaris]